MDISQKASWQFYQFYLSSLIGTGDFKFCSLLKMKIQSTNWKLAEEIPDDGEELARNMELDGCLTHPDG